VCAIVTVMPERPADIVFTRGHARTVDPRQPRAEAVAVHGERISAVGSADEIASAIGPTTRVIDLGGRLLLPGFQDAHVHPLAGGMDQMQCDLREAEGRQAVLATIRVYADEHSGDDWIIGSGWYMGDFPGGLPRREELDSVLADRPGFFPNRDGHSAWVNSRALELAGITRDTPDPADGRIERDPDGTPTGALHEGAVDLVEPLLPVPGPDEWLAAFRFAQTYLHSLGITAWQDAIVTPDDLAVYRRAAEAGLLTARVEAALWWERTKGAEQVDELVARSATGSSGRLRANSVKIALDGVLETFTGAMIDPYLDREGRPTTNRGIDFVEAEPMREHVARLDAAGLQVHFHAIGDRAVRVALDSVEAARRANGMTDTRPHISHIQVVHPEDVPRFGPLGAVANAQPLWACHETQMDELTIPILGPERSRWQYPFASLLRSGARLAMGSDWSVSTPNPLLEIEVAVTRIYPTSRDTARPFLPEERLTLEQAIEAFTLGSAYVNHLDDETGTIATGKLADLAVIDRDLFAPDAGPIGDAKVLATFVGGKVVFEDPALGG
jgi:predicted amidohydrolase YtcJ